MKLAAGDTAPAFALPDQGGTTHALEEYRGKWVLIYFYPKDDTPGCTKEACGIRDQFASFGAVGAAVLGISTDSPRSHRTFADKYDLPFTLLADEEKTVVKQYGVWGRKRFMGRAFFGAKRMSFLIDPQGRIAKVYAKVKPAEHAAQVLRDLRALRG